MNQKIFFDSVRRGLFGGSLSAGQVSGLQVLLAAIAVLVPALSLEAIAYVLATVYHETARTMQPIAEYGHGRGHTYGKADPVTGQAYYGRGYVQLTWKDNYAKLGKLLGVDLVNFPELALIPATAARILLVGMIRGLFTGKKLADYMVPGKIDFVGARRIVNGTDKAQQIAGHAARFLEALMAAHAAPAEPVVPVAPAPVPVIPAVPDAPAAAPTTSLWTLILRLVFKLTGGTLVRPVS